MRTSKRIFFGFSVPVVAKATGLPDITIYRHLDGQRISAECAMKYHKKLGIPLWELRPDLWERPAEAHNA